MKCYFKKIGTPKAIIPLYQKNLSVWWSFLDRKEGREKNQGENIGLIKGSAAGCVIAISDLLKKFISLITAIISWIL